MLKKSDKSSVNSTKIIFWNINGLRAAFSKNLQKIVKDFDADIYCFQEVKIQDEQLNEEMRTFGLNYQSFFSFAEKKGYSGVATYYKSSLPLKKQSVQRGINNSIIDKEGRILIVNFENFDLYNIYFPSGTTGPARQEFKYKFLDAIYDYFSHLSKHQRARAVIVGDFNICHKEIDIHHPDKATKLELSGFLPKEREWMDKFVELGFIDTFRHINGNKTEQYSWWSFRANSRNKNLGWRIDYCFVAKEMTDNITNADIFSAIQGSDHCPIGVCLRF
jgi:exodeoxyribonuclease III